MQNQVKVFQDEEFGEIEVIMIEGKPYFPATDCARLLGYKNPRKAVTDHCRVDGVTKRYGVSTTTNQHGAWIWRTH